MAKITKLSQIEKLKPEFKFGGITMVEWFETKQIGQFCFIRSGLRHADGETKSPFFYDEWISGEDAEKRSIEQFNIWWGFKSKLIDVSIDRFGYKSKLDKKYSNCQICKFKDLPQESQECTYCYENNKENEYYIND